MTSWQGGNCYTWCFPGLLLSAAAFRYGLPLGLKFLGKFAPGGTVCPRGVRGQIGRGGDDGHGVGLPCTWFWHLPGHGREVLKLSTEN